MTKQSSQQTPASVLNQLVDALDDLRDALVNASLTLQEVQFDLDSDKRNAANQSAQELINKAKN